MLNCVAGVTKVCATRGELQVNRLINAIRLSCHITDTIECVCVYGNARNVNGKEISITITLCERLAVCEQILWKTLAKVSLYMTNIQQRKLANTLQEDCPCSWLASNSTSVTCSIKKALSLITELDLESSSRARLISWNICTNLKASSCPHVQFANRNGCFYSINSP